VKSYNLSRFSLHPTDANGIEENVMRANPVKRVLKAGQPSVGTWLSLGSITASRFLARAGFAWLTVDIEHSLVDWETATHMFASIADAGCVALARVPSNRHDHIKRVLDNGAHGIVVPMVNSRQEALDAVSACLYPPAGTRSVGGSVHALNFGGTAVDYFARANDELLIVLQCEHIQAVENADSIFSVPGIDAVFVGPNDLAASMRSKDGKPPSGEATAQAHKHVLATCKKQGVPAGIHCFSAEEVRARIEEGWQFLAIGSELRMMLDGVKNVLDRLGRHQQAEHETQMAKY
jgi:4-hydroxy-2-oxoheptanedioate aldolase